MKKLRALALILVYMLGLTGCNKDTETMAMEGIAAEAVEQEKTEYSIQEITSLFFNNAESDWQLVECVSVYDFAYDRIGVVLYTEKDVEYINVAFIDEEGFMQHCKIEAVLDEKTEFTYHGNGEVTFNVCSREGKKYKQKIIFSLNNEAVHFVSESLEL